MKNEKPKYKGVKFTTPEGRCSFPALFTPKAKYKKPDEFEFSIEVLFDEKTSLDGFTKACDMALAEVYGNDKKAWPKNIIYPLVDQEVLIDKLKEGQSSDHLTPGAMYARFKTNATNAKPIVVGSDNETIMDANDVYGGCYVRVGCQIKVNEIPQTDPKTKKPAPPIVYVTPYLAGVQKTKDGDAFGGRPDAASMFEPISGDSLTD